MHIRLLPICLLAGCSALVPETAIQMSTLSPLTADPAAIALALTLPDGVGIRDNGATLFLGAVREDTAEDTGITVTLARQNDALLGEIFEIAPADHAAFRAEQAQISTWKDQAPNATKGTLSFAFAPCRAGTGPAPDARGTVLVRLGDDASFQPLLRDAPIDRLASQRDIAAWPACGDTSRE